MTTAEELEAVPSAEADERVARLAVRLAEAEAAELRASDIHTTARHVMQGIRVDGPEFPNRMAAMHEATMNLYRAQDERRSAKRALADELQQQEH